MTLMQAEINDWQLHPSLYTNLLDFQGEPNTRETGSKIEERVRSKIITSKLVLDEDLDIRVVPVGYHEVLIRLTVFAIATPGNRLTPGEPIVINLLYDSLENGVFFVPLDQTKRNGI